MCSTDYYYYKVPVALALASPPCGYCFVAVAAAVIAIVVFAVVIVAVVMIVASCYNFGAVRHIMFLATAPLRLLLHDNSNHDNNNNMNSTCMHNQIIK
jgi:hypothetical protein